jgi:hypothetical protein
LEIVSKRQCNIGIAKFFNYKAVRAGDWYAYQILSKNLVLDKMLKVLDKIKSLHWTSHMLVTRNLIN